MKREKPRRYTTTTVLLLLLAGACSRAGASSSEGSPAVDVDLITSAHEQSACSSAFVPHVLDHETRGPGRSTSTFDGTGAGVAVGDVDEDGRPDLVLANLHGNTVLLRNRGALTFESTPLIQGRIRQPAIVDVDGDGDLDVSLTTGLGLPLLLDNDGAGQFERTQYDGVEAVTFAMAWGDLGGDGDLDLVTGSYNAELTFRQQHHVLLGPNVGIVRHEQLDDGSFETTRLTDVSQALAVHLADVDGDGQPDILAGNDLATPDQLWLETADGPVPADLFSTTSYSTMSLDTADIDNDGGLDIYSTDMQPMDASDATREAYAPIVAEMAAMPIPDNVQHPRNVLQSLGGAGYVDVAGDFGVEATGWSWSGVFGDLDQDGLQDLYVVNGMVSDELFGERDHAALSEPNQAFRGSLTGFSPAPDWGLADMAQGRGVVMADLDADGDLDIVVNNLNSPSVVHENQLCAGAAITIDLRWPQSRNSHAIGAAVEVSLDSVVATRTISASRGYLSSPSATVHVGVGDADVADVAITWPDGATSTLVDVAVGQHLVVTRQ